jgi:hypothetical protein
MEQNENVASVATKKNTVRIKCKEAQFRVFTKGYNETFGSLENAKKQYDFLKKRSVKNHEPIKLELSVIEDNGSKKILETVNIGEDFYSE